MEYKEKIEYKRKEKEYKRNIKYNGINGTKGKFTINEKLPKEEKMDYQAKVRYKKHMEIQRYKKT